MKKSEFVSIHTSNRRSSVSDFLIGFVDGKLALVGWRETSAETLGRDLTRSVLRSQEYPS